MNSFNFVKFDGYYSRGDNKIGINKSGLVRLSSGFCRDTDIKKFKFVVLYYDKDNNAVAFKFTNIKEDGRLKVTVDGTGATVSASKFLKANNLNLRSYFRRYEWEKKNLPGIGEVFIIRLNSK